MPDGDRQNDPFGPSILFSRMAKIFSEHVARSPMLAQNFHALAAVLPGRSRNRRAPKRKCLH
jgi:hypothetical protein